MEERRMVSGRVADGPARALVLAAFVAAATLLGVTASLSVQRAPVPSSPDAHRSAR